MKELIRFFKSLKDPCKLCLVKAACYQGQDCSRWINHVKAKRNLKSFTESTAAITLIISALFGFLFVCVLIILGTIKFHELLF